MYRDDKPKTVSWYIHTFNLYILSLVIITPDRQNIYCSPGRGLLEYGHFRVLSVVLIESTAYFLLRPEEYKFI